MKRITISKLWQEGSRVLKKIPKEGMYVTYKGKPIAYVTKPDPELLKKQDKELQKALGKEIDEKIRMIQVDTFTQMEAPEPQKMGVCNRCGRQGEVKQWNWLEPGHIESTKGYLCTSYCYPKFNEKNPKTRPMKGPKPIIKSVPQQMTQNHRAEGKQQRDFGPANEHGSF